MQKYGKYESSETISNHYEFSWQSLALCSSEKCVEMREKIGWCQLDVPGAYAVLNFSRIDILFLLQS